MQKSDLKGNVHFQDDVPRLLVLDDDLFVYKHGYNVVTFLSITISELS